ncbi:hypothetical protein F5878DRAFT_636721 [Lentinula raphanica]|uniref:Uncharacterized protein n=1 Tax=Lentinula raphanica TaxID=153919 RepID=A0AA38PLT9_9AGAR|nr:hypothetical protein F5878DRAFT_636721 [Lentinula raphanica]
MNLYRLLLFVTLAVHVSSTSVQPLPDSDSKNVQNPAPSPAPNIPSPSYDSKPLPKGEESKLPLSGGLGQGHTTGDDLVHTNPDAVKTVVHAVLFDQAFNGEDGGPKCVNITTATKMKKRGVEGSKKEEEEGTCKVVREGTCPCEAATGTVDSDGKIVEQPGGVKDVKHTKRAVLKAVHRKRTTATI